MQLFIIDAILRFDEIFSALGALAIMGYTRLRFTYLLKSMHDVVCAEDVARCSCQGRTVKA